MQRFHCRVRLEGNSVDWNGKVYFWNVRPKEKELTFTAVPQGHFSVRNKSVIHSISTFLSNATPGNSCGSPVGVVVGNELENSLWQLMVINSAQLFIIWWPHSCPMLYRTQHYQLKIKTCYEIALIETTFYINNVYFILGMQGRSYLVLILKIYQTFICDHVSALYFLQNSWV